MALTILDEVLLEEYDRCERQRQMHLDRLSSLPASSAGSPDVLKRREMHLRALVRIDDDMQKIRRALEGILTPTGEASEEDNTEVFVKRMRTYEERVDEELLRLTSCPLCKKKARMVEGEVGDFFVRCSENCPSPTCAHQNPLHTAISWNDFVFWYRACRERGVKLK